MTPDEQIDRLHVLLSCARWTWSRDRSHQWTERSSWSDPADFEWCVVTIRTLGYWHRFGGTRWRACDVGAHFYWSFWRTPALTRIINRRPGSGRAHLPLFE